MGFLLREEKENLLVEYNALRQEILDREYKTWVINAILIMGSLFTAFSPVINNFNGAILSVVLIVSGILLHGTAEHVNRIGQSRIEEIAKELRLTGPTRTYHTKIAGQWWYTLRRNVAYALFAVLVSVYLFIISNSLDALVISLFAGTVFVAFKEGFWQIWEQHR